MSQESKNGYMLIFRGTDWYAGLSAEEMQAVADNWMAWFKRLTDQGKVIAGNPLEREGKIVSGKNGRIISDGPFAETKETIGGYFLLKVGTFDEAGALPPQIPWVAFRLRVGVGPGCRGWPLAEGLRSA